MTESQSPASPANDTPASFALRSQYIKDMSFENPRAPEVYSALEHAPAIDVQLDLTASRLSESLFELAIHVAVRATHEKHTVFLVDLVYGGLFEAVGIPDDQLEQAVLVQGAFLLFPYARRIVSDVTRDGGFPALNLEPVDFFALYARNRQPA
jgi:preprotein translocase subunit SecB